MNKTIIASLLGFENEGNRSKKFDEIQSEYFEVLSKIKKTLPIESKELVNELSALFEECTREAQDFYFESGFKYGLEAWK